MLTPSWYLRNYFLRAFSQGGRVTLPVASTSSIVFRPFIYMSRRVTLGLGSPYQLIRVTLLGGSAFCLLKPYRSPR